MSYDGHDHRGEHDDQSAGREIQGLREDMRTAGERIRELAGTLAGALEIIRMLDRLRPTCVICMDAAADRQTSRGPACTDCAGDAPDGGAGPDDPQTWAFGEAGGRTFTHPDVFTAGIAEGWAEAETDPARIDWPARQARAAIPFKVVNGRPVNPCAQTGIRHGRNELGLWGENLMADALVTVTCGHYRYLLMVERGDGYGWAVPGGAAEPGETAVQAALRELAEETGLTVDPGAARAGEPLYVPDPRASDEAWAVTVPVTADLGGSLLGLPHVNGGDDARRAEWIRAGCYEDLEATLRQVRGGQVFAAHEAMLRRFLGTEAQ